MAHADDTNSIELDMDDIQWLEDQKFAQLYIGKDQITLRIDISRPRESPRYTGKTILECIRKARNG